MALMARVGGMFSFLVLIFPLLAPFPPQWLIGQTRRSARTQQRQQKVGLPCCCGSFVMIVFAAWGAVVRTGSHLVSLLFCTRPTFSPLAMRKPDLGLRPCHAAVVSVVPDRIPTHPFHSAVRNLAAAQHRPGQADLGSARRTRRCALPPAHATCTSFSDPCSQPSQQRVC